MSASTDTSREAARQASGRFGIQPHDESGVVEPDPGTADALAIHELMDAYEAHFGFEAEFELGPSADFRADVAGAAKIVSDATPGATFGVEYRTDADGSPLRALLSLTDEQSGLTVINFVPESDLTLDADASGTNGAWAVFGALLGHRRYLQRRYAAGIRAITDSSVSSSLDN